MNFQTATRRQKRSLLNSVKPRTEGSFLLVTGFEPKKKIPKRLPVWRFPSQIELQYQKELLRLVREWNYLYKGLIEPHLEGLAQRAYVMRPDASSNIKTDEFLDGVSLREEGEYKLDGWVEDLKTIAANFSKKVLETIFPFEAVAKDFGEKTSAYNLSQWDNQVKSAFNTRVIANEPWLNDQLSSFSSQNTAVITKLGNETVQDIERIVTSGFQSGRRVEDIKKSIQNGTKKQVGVFKKARNKAKLISDTQVSSLNGQLTQLRQTNLGISQYTWRTAQDKRVRKSHKPLEGKICRWDNTTLYKDTLLDKKWKQRSSIGAEEVAPGQAIRCRCSGEANMQEVEV